ESGGPQPYKTTFVPRKENARASKVPAGQRTRDSAKLVRGKHGRRFGEVTRQGTLVNASDDRRTRRLSSTSYSKSYWRAANFSIFRPSFFADTKNKFLS